MAKELPYFKFNCSEWISGGITLEPLEVQGAFVNICAHYWFKSGCLKLTEIKQRLKLKQATINRLIEGNHIKISEDSIEITFLRDQFNERGHISERNSKNGSKGGAPKGNKNAEKNNREQPKTTNIEEEREEEKKESNIYILGPGLNFFTVQKKYITDKAYRVHGVDGLAEYMISNQSVLKNPEKADSFMEKFNGAQFNDFMHVFNTYNKFLQTNGNRNGFKNGAIETVPTFSGDYSSKL